MKRKIVEIKKHKAGAVDANRRDRGAKLIEVTTLVFACGHTRIYRGTGQSIPRFESSCRECDHAVVSEHFADRNFVKRAAQSGPQ